MEKDVKALTEIEEKLHALSEKDRKRIVEWLHEKYCPVVAAMPYCDNIFRIINTPSMDRSPVWAETKITYES